MNLQRGLYFVKIDKADLNLQYGIREGNSALLGLGGKVSSAPRATEKEALNSDIALSYHVRQTPNQEQEWPRLAYPTIHA